MSGERLAIAVCTHNRGPAIVRTLEALAALEPAGGRVARVLVVDNASTDGTGDVVRGFIGRHTGAIAFACVHEPTPGKVAAMARALRETGEELVGIVDDDVLVEPGWARAMLGAMDDLPRAGLVGGRIDLAWASGPTRLAQKYRQSLAWQDRGSGRERLEGRGSFLAGASVVYRRAAVEATGWPEGALLDCRRGALLQGGEDAELCLRIRRAGWEVWYDGAAGCAHQIPAHRQTTAYLARLRESIGATEPVLRWIAEGGLDARIVERERARARRLALKTLLTDWRPTRRRIRLGERRGRVRGWDAVATLLG